MVLSLEGAIAVAMAAGAWAGSRVAVAGGAGVVGAALCERLVALGARVRVVDNLSSGRRENLKAIAGAVEWVEGDLRDRGFARGSLAGSDVVLNVAGYAPGLMERPDHGKIEAENLAIAEGIGAAVDALGVRRYLVVSSSCVYPDDAPVPTPEMALEGTVPEHGNRGYGWAKRKIEAAAQALGRRRHGISVRIARPFNVLSPLDRKTGEGGHVIPSLLERVLSGDVVNVWGSGAQTRSFIHAADLAEGLLGLAALDSGVDAAPVNIGSDEEISMAQLVALLAELSGVPLRVAYDLSKPEGALRKAADCRRLRRLLPWYRARYGVREGLAQVVARRLR